MVVGGSEAPIIPVGLGGFVACRALQPDERARRRQGELVHAGMITFLQVRHHST